MEVGGVSPQDPQPGNRFVSFVRASEARRSCVGAMLSRVLGLGEAQSAVLSRVGSVLGLSRGCPGCPVCVKTREMGFICSPGEQMKPIFRVLTQAGQPRDNPGQPGTTRARIRHGTAEVSSPSPSTRRTTRPRSFASPRFARTHERNETISREGPLAL